MFNRYKERGKANMKFKVIGKEQSSVLKTTFSLFLLTSIRVFNLRLLVYKQIQTLKSGKNTIPLLAISPSNHVSHGEEVSLPLASREIDSQVGLSQVTLRC